MTNYKKSYFMLFNGITEVTEQLEQLNEILTEAQDYNKNFSQLKRCISNLKRIQIEAEETFLSEMEE